MVVLIFLILQCLALLSQPSKVDLPALVATLPTTFSTPQSKVVNIPPLAGQTAFFKALSQADNDLTNRLANRIAKAFFDPLVIQVPPILSQTGQAEHPVMPEPVSMLLKNFFVIGFGLILILAFLLYQAFEEKKHINELLQSKNEEIQSKNEEIEKQKKIIENRHDTLQQALFEIDQQKTKLETYNATKDKFFSIIAHDLKSPLNSLQGFSALLMACAESLTLEDIRAVATKLNEQIKNTVQLTDNLLTWARLQMDNEEFQPEPLHLPQIVEENIDLLAPIASLKDIRLEANLSDMIVVANAEQLKFILRNLMANAIKFSYPNNVILIEAVKNDTVVEVSVTDYGIGMNQDMVDVLFRVDARHQTIGTAGEKGTGLGLILCKEFVEKNKGQLWVRSQEKQGSTFTFTLPSLDEQQL